MVRRSRNGWMPSGGKRPKGKVLKYIIVHFIISYA